MKSINKNINIFVLTHKKSLIPDNKFLIPIQLGKENNSLNLNILADNTGNNISKLNPFFCELTGLYWVWKNVDADYYGFFHYRRYLSLSNKNNKIPNLRRAAINDDALKEFEINEKNIEEICKNYDLIIPKRVKLKKNRFISCSVYNQYKLSEHHDINDLNEAINITNHLYPDFAKYLKKGLKGNVAYFLNVFIMKKQYFFEYCNWLFPILFEFHKNKNYSSLTQYEKRAVGFVAERLLTVFIYYLKDKYKNIRIKECPVIFFTNTEKY